MARQINANFSGVQMNDTRPGAYATESTMQKMTGDQAHAYEVLSNQPVPGAGSITANGVHNHTITDGTNDTGALVRHPHHINFMEARLYPRATNLTDDLRLFTPFYWQPVYIPPGTDHVSVVLVCLRGENKNKRLKRFRMKIYDVDTTVGPITFTETIGKSFENSTISNEFYISESAGSPFETIYARISPAQKDFSSGGIFLFRVDAWDGAAFLQYNDSEEDDQVELNTVNSLMILPVKQKPILDPYQWTQAQQTTGTAISTPAAFQPVEADWVQDDRSINSAVLTNSSRNDSLLYEVTTGRPAGNKAVQTHNGHNHANWTPGSSPARGGTTDLDDVGQEISWNLGTWQYGVLREPINVASGSFFDLDMTYEDGTASPVTPSNSVWAGRIIAPTINNSHSSQNKWATVSEHIVRLPAGTDVNTGVTGSASKFSAVVFVANSNTGGTNTLDVELSMYDINRANQGAVQVQSSTQGPRAILRFDNLEPPTNATGNGDLVRLSIRFKKSRNSDFVAVYGLTLFYEA